MSKPSRPSLVDFMAQPAPDVKASKSSRAGEDTIALTFRMPRSMWEQVLLLTMSQRTKIQPYLMSLVEKDFAERGLRTK